MANQRKVKYPGSEIELKEEKTFHSNFTFLNDWQMLYINLESGLSVIKQRSCGLKIYPQAFIEYPKFYLP